MEKKTKLSARDLRLLFLLIVNGTKSAPPLKVIRAWSNEYREKVRRYISAVHLRASDNIVRKKDLIIPKGLKKYL